MRRVCRSALVFLLFALPALPAAAFSLLSLDPDPLDLELLLRVGPSGATNWSTLPVNDETMRSPRTCPNSCTTSRNDDLGGRDVLYPVPETSTVALVAAGLARLGFRAPRSERPR